MNTTSTATALEEAREEASERAAIPWPVWSSVLAVTSAMIGVHWDISWHRSIGRDSFLTAPHLAIYLSGVIGGVIAASLILGTTFGPKERRASSVRVFGFRGPLGAFVLAWGGIAMLTSAPFDNWWHNTYGLDVRIISPPHALLSLGILSVELGALLLVLGYMNRSSGPSRKVLGALFLYIGAMRLVAVLVFLLERTDRTEMHTAHYYRDLCLALPWVLVGVSCASDARWAATTMAAILSLFQIALLWILPLFPAVPKLGPVYHPVTHFVPPPFPLLIVVPAIAIDLHRIRAASRSRDAAATPWKEALVLGALFFATYLAAQWTFADFLLSPESRNWVFGTHYFGYNARSTWNIMRHVFAPRERAIPFAVNLGLAVILAVLTSRLGLSWGAWMRRIHR
jgi:hypothetical protein